MQNLKNFLNLTMLNYMDAESVHEAKAGTAASYKVKIHDGSILSNVGSYNIDNDSEFMCFEWDDSRTDIAHISEEDFNTNQKNLEKHMGIDEETWEDIKDSCKPGESWMYPNGVVIRLK